MDAEREALRKALEQVRAAMLIDSRYVSPGAWCWCGYAGVTSHQGMCILRNKALAAADAALAAEGGRK